MSDIVIGHMTNPRGSVSFSRSQTRVCVRASALCASVTHKRDLVQCQKRPSTVAKETYYSPVTHYVPSHTCRRVSLGVFSHMCVRLCPFSDSPHTEAERVCVRESERVIGTVFHNISNNNKKG